jgi:large subunit ribosomal protein L25
MSEYVLNALPRTNKGKRAKQSRLQGNVPGVYYSRGEENLSVEVLSTNLDPLIHTSKTYVIDLRLADGTSKKCILRDVQFDPVSDAPIHFDLQGLKENERLTVEVPVITTGAIPVGVRDGGMVQHSVHKVRVSCLPKDIPEKVEVDISGLAINQFIHVRDLQIPNVTILDNPENFVVGVMPPNVIKEEVAAVVATEEPKEPEVVGKGKKAEEGEGEGEAPKPEKEKK